MTDEHGATSTATLTVTITGTNDAPVAVADTNAGDPVVEAGVNPIEARDRERQTADTRTFSALAGRYLREHAERHKRPRSAEEDRRNLALHVLPKWARREFRNFNPGDAGHDSALLRRKPRGRGRRCGRCGL